MAVLKEHAVAIAGGGPAGLMLAGELALAGVDVAVFERRATRDLEGLRAGGLHARTIEVLDQRGIADRFLSQGQTTQKGPFAGSILDISDLPTRHNYFLALWQTRIEHTLADWVLEMAVPIYYGTEVRGFAQHETGVDIELSDGRSTRTQYLVGCDGGRSSIRKNAGIKFPGWDPSVSYVIAEIETAQEPAWGFRRNSRGISAIAKLEGERKARVVLSERDIGDGNAPNLSDIRDALIASYETDFGLTSASYISRFSDMTRQAESYRKGRVILAGDAAHVHSPVGGQGLNLGVQDAVNLGWKLGQIIHGKSPESLLDTYHSERHPVAARVLRNTMALTAIERSDERSEALRGMLHEMLQSDATRKQYFAMMSGLDIRYDLGMGHPLLGRRIPDLDLETDRGPRRVFSFLNRARPVLLNLGEVYDCDISPWVDRVEIVNARYAGTLELQSLGMIRCPSALLVRPDGYVGWVGDRSQDGLVDALTMWCGPAART